jgi:hypothetical protein
MKIVTYVRSEQKETLIFLVRPIYQMIVDQLKERVLYSHPLSNTEYPSLPIPPIELLCLNSHPTTPPTQPADGRRAESQSPASV